MSAPTEMTHDPAQSETDFTLNVVFSFASQWELTSSGGAQEQQRLRLPPGGGDRIQTIEIGPLHLEGLSTSEVAALVRKRADTLTLLNEAIAIASIEFSTALAQASHRPPTT